jgi:glycosyltransferase involved in cell wall biosynthesis
MAVFLAAFAVLPGAWTARNYARFGRFLPGSTLGGFNLYTAMVVPEEYRGTDREYEFESRDPHWRTIHNGVETEWFKPRGRAECLQHFPQLDGLNDIVLFSGRMIALKGIDVAIKSLALIHKETDATFIFAGAGKVEPWKRMLDDLKVPPNRYLFLGSVPYTEIPYLYSLASIFMLPSYSESFPMTVLEAMACGLPVVASNVGGIPEMIDSNENGILIQPGNEKGLSAALLKLLGDRSFAKRLAMSARTKACDEFSSLKMATDTAEMYRSTVEGFR